MVAVRERCTVHVCVRKRGALEPLGAHRLNGQTFPASTMPTTAMEHSRRPSIPRQPPSRELLEDVSVPGEDGAAGEGGKPPLEQESAVRVTSRLQTDGARLGCAFVRLLFYGV